MAPDDDLERELRAHIDLLAQDQQAQGASEEEAHRAARRRFGSVSLTKEDVRSLSPLAAWSDAVQDLRYGLRLLRKRPGFAIAAALTLALGVGATTAVFSVVETVLMRPLPYPDVDRLAMVWEDIKLPTYTNARNTPAPGNFRDWRAQNSSFVDLAAIRNTVWTLTGAGEPARIDAVAASASLFRLLGVTPALGRTFTDAEDLAVPSSIVLLGHDLWTSRFGADASIVGKRIQLNETLLMVVGVLPAGFHFPDRDVQLWMPLGLSPQQLANHDGHFLRVAGRLKPGVTIAQAQADMDRIAGRLAVQFPNTNRGGGVNVVPLTEQIVGEIRAPLLVISAVVAFLLLMVCTNIGNLLLARASARRHEFALRTALGASRKRLVRQMLAEGALLAVAGGAIGLVFAWSGVRVLQWLAPRNFPRLDELSFDGTMALFDAGVALVAGLICSVAPALRSGATEDVALRAEDRSSGTRTSVRTRNLLVVLQVALSVVVLVGAGLLLQSFLRLTRVPVGFQSDGVLTFRVALAPARYRALEQRSSFYRRVADRLHALPGVSSAAAISFLPLTMSGRVTGISIDADTDPVQVRMSDFRSVSPGYFGTMSVPVRAGRDVSWTDTPAAIPAVVVSETAARTFWPGQNPIGRRLKRGRPQDQTAWLTVVGDVHQLDLVQTPRPALYFPATQDPGVGDTLRDWVVRSDNPAAIASAVGAIVREADATLPVTNVRMMADWQSAATASPQFILTLVGAFAVIALLLAAVGLYGVTAYAVAQRTRELGIRMALGARPRAVLGSVLAHGVRLTGLGLAVGVLVALGLTRLMTAVLYETGPRDPVTYAAVATLLVAVSLIASIWPAYRATRVQPVIALRS